MWTVGPKQGRGLGSGWGQCSGPTGLEKALGPWGVGLRLKEQKGPRCAPHPWSQRAGDLTWEPSRLPGLEWAGQTPSSPLLLLQSGVWEGPSHLPLLISPASGALILSGHHFSSPFSPPTSYQLTLGFLPSPWASESPTSSWQEPSLWGDANSTSSHTAILTLPS